MSDELQDGVKLYGNRDPHQQDCEGGYFIRHMHHMTTENLRGKAEIAEELAHRDIQIDRLCDVLEQTMHGIPDNGNLALKAIADNALKFHGRTLS